VGTNLGGIGARRKVSALLLLSLLVAIPFGRSAEAAPASSHPQVVHLHYDYMVQTGGKSPHSDAPDPASIQLVVDAFAQHGIKLVIEDEHTEIPEVNTTILPSSDNSFQDIVSECTYDYAHAYPPQPNGGVFDLSHAANFYDLKAMYFHSNQPNVHYVIFVKYSVGITDDGGCGPFTGMSELPGSNFLVALGQVHGLTGHAFNILEGGVFMHELGHNFGLRHGGGEDQNYKPNYVSIMNYLYMYVGIREADSVGSSVPDPALTHLDYSEQVLPTGGNTPGFLDKQNLNEPAGLGSGTADMFMFKDGACSPDSGGPTRIAPTTGPVDWDGDGVATNLHAAADIDAFQHNCGDEPTGLLAGFADWPVVHTCIATLCSFPDFPGHGHTKP
jgi:hypothetical protein